MPRLSIRSSSALCFSAEIMRWVHALGHHTRYFSFVKEIGGMRRQFQIEKFPVPKLAAPDFRPHPACGIGGGEGLRDFAESANNLGQSTFAVIHMSRAKVTIAPIVIVNPLSPSKKKL